MKNLLNTKVQEMTAGQTLIYSILVGLLVLVPYAIIVGIVTIWENWEGFSYGVELWLKDLKKKIQKFRNVEDLED